MNHSSTLGFSPRLPVSVYGTGIYTLTLAGFLGSLITAIIRASEDLRYFLASTPNTDLPI